MGQDSSTLSYIILPYYRIEAPFSQRKGTWPSPSFFLRKRRGRRTTPHPFNEREQRKGSWPSPCSSSEEGVAPPLTLSMKESRYSFPEREIRPTTSSLRKGMWRRVYTHFYTRWLSLGYGFCKFAFWVLRSWILPMVS